MKANRPWRCAGHPPQRRAEGTGETMNANRQPAVNNDRISEVQMSLNYAKQVAQVVKDRRLSELRRRRDELLALPVTHSVDIELRNDLVRELDAQIKQVEASR